MNVMRPTKINIEKSTRKIQILHSCNNSSWNFTEIIMIACKVIPENLVLMDAKMTFENHLICFQCCSSESLLVSWESPGKYFMIGRSFRDIFWAFFLSIFPAQQYGAQQPIHTLSCWVELARVLIVKLAVFWSATLLIDNLWQCCACYLRLRVTQCILWAVHCFCSMCRRVLLVVLWLLKYSFAPPLCRKSQYRRTFVPLSLSLGYYLCTLYLMVWDWRVLWAEPMLSCWPNLLFLFLSPTILSFSSFHGLVVCGWGLRIDRVFSLSLDLALLTVF